MSLTERLTNFQASKAKFDSLDLSGQTCRSLNHLLTSVNVQEALQQAITLSAVTTTSLKDHLTMVGPIGYGTHNLIFRVSLKNSHLPDLALKQSHQEVEELSVGLAYTADYYALILSNLVEQGVCLNFPLVVQTYVTDLIEYPITLMELAETNLFKYKESGTHQSYVQSLVQILCAVYFLNQTLHLRHNDLKSQNILIKTIEPTCLTYRLGSRCLTMETQVLALLTDFDLIGVASDPTYEYFDYYVAYLLKKLPACSSRIRKIVQLTKQSTSVCLDIVQLMLNSLLDHQNDSVGQAVVLNFITDYLSQSTDFFTLLANYYGDYLTVSQTCPADYQVFELSFELAEPSLNYATYPDLYSGLTLNPNMRDQRKQYFWRNFYGLARFNSKNLTVNEYLEQATKLPSELLEDRAMVIEWVNDLARALKIDEWQVVTALQILDFYLQQVNQVTNFETMEVISLLALYLVEISPGLHLRFIARRVIDSSMEKITKLLKKLLSILRQTLEQN